MVRAVTWFLVMLVGISAFQLSTLIVVDAADGPRWLANLVALSLCAATAVAFAAMDRHSRRRRSPGTSGGVELTDDCVDRLSAEAERGYPVERLRPHSKQPPP